MTQNKPQTIIESRSQGHTFEVRAQTTEGNPTTHTIEGYALLYNTRTDMGGYTEIILPGACDSIVVNSDCKALLNHDPNIILARSKFGKGTLTLTPDDKGLRFKFTSPQHRSDVVEMIDRGDLDQCSFRFIIDEEKWETADGVDERQLIKFEELIDITLATFPSYADTTVALRSRDEFRSKNLTPELVEGEKEERLRELELIELRA